MGLGLAKILQALAEARACKNLANPEPEQSHQTNQKETTNEKQITLTFCGEVRETTRIHAIWGLA